MHIINNWIYGFSVISRYTYIRTVYIGNFGFYINHTLHALVRSDRFCLVHHHIFSTGNEKSHSAISKILAERVLAQYFHGFNSNSDVLKSPENSSVCHCFLLKDRWQRNVSLQYWEAIQLGTSKCHGPNVEIYFTLDNSLWNDYSICIRLFNIKELDLTLENTNRMKLVYIH